MMRTELSPADLEAVRSRGSAPETVTRQLELLRRPRRYAELVGACTADDGIVRIEPD